MSNANTNLLNELSISNNGGTTIVTRNVQGEDANSAPVRTRFHEVPGHQTLTVGSDHPIYNTPTTMQYDASQDSDANPEEGLVTRHGNVQGDLTDDSSLLRIKGMEIDMPTAMKHGLVVKNANGYSLTDKAKDTMQHNADASAETQVKRQQGTPVADTKARSGNLARLEQAIGGPALHNVIQTTLAAFSDGHKPKDMSTLETAAKAAGMSVQEVSTTISNAMQGSEAKAVAALRKAGVDADAVMEHLWNNVDSKTRVSVLAGLIAGDPAALNYAVQLKRTGNKR